MTEGEKMYTIDEAAEILRMNRFTVWRRCRDGSIRALQIGRQWRIPASALDELQNRPPKPATKDNAP